MKLYDTFLFKTVRMLLVYLSIIMMALTISFCFLITNTYFKFFNSNKKLEFSYYIVSSTIRFYLKFLFWIKIDIEGNIDKTKKVLLTNNHISLFDSIVLGAYLYEYINPNYNTLIWYTFMNIPILGYIFKTLEFIPIGYSDYNKKTKLDDNIIECLNKNNNVYIFFEGKLNDNPTKLQEIKKGVFNYHKYSNGIKFIGIKGIDKIWSHNGCPVGYGTIKIKFFDGLYKFDTFEETQDKIHELYDNYIKV